MRPFLRFLLWSVLIIAALGAGLFFYFLYAPAPEIPQLAGRLAPGTIEAGGRVRSYLSYIPRDMPKGAPLVMVMHGSGESGARMRIASGYGFERLADEHRFAVVYPNGFEGFWNACNTVGDFAANTLNIDDVGFLTALAGKLTTEVGVDPQRVFATGLSRGGAMAFRLALEAPTRFRAVAAIAASMPTPDNSKCTPASGGTSSVMIMNGTEDPLNPFNGGEVRLYGLLARGAVRSSKDSAAYFAGLNNITSAPETRTSRTAEDFTVEDTIWRSDKTEVELVAIHGTGHVIPQPYFRFPRILGATPKEPNGPALIWDFFARQRRR